MTIVNRGEGDTVIYRSRTLGTRDESLLLCLRKLIVCVWHSWHILIASENVKKLGSGEAPLCTATHVSCLATTILDFSEYPLKQV